MCLPSRATDEDGEKELERTTSDESPFAALAFKIATDPFVGSLTFFRVYSGVLKSGDTVYNSNKQRKDRIGRVLQMHANSREELSEVRAGDIAAAVGLKNVTTGETLCDPKAAVVLERMEFPEPVIAVAVEPKTKVDQEKMGVALGKLAHEDPSFRVSTDDESGQTIIAGMGELHLEIIVDRLKREFKVEANVGQPQVAYRETIRKSVEEEAKFVRQTGGRGQYGHVCLRIEPSDQGRGFEFVDAVVGGAIPKDYIPAVRKGVSEQLENGVIAGYPLVDVKVTLYDGSYHEVDSNEMAFKIAGSMCLEIRRRQGLARAAGAHHEGRGGQPRGLHGRRHGRSEPPARNRARHGRDAGRARHPRRGSAERNVRLRHRSAFAYAGPRDLHDGVLEVSRGAHEHRRRDTAQEF